MKSMAEEYNESIRPTAERPWLYVHKSTGFRYTFPERSHAFYLRTVGEKQLMSLYTISKFDTATGKEIPHVPA